MKISAVWGVRRDVRNDRVGACVVLHVKRIQDFRRNNFLTAQPLSRFTHTLAARLPYHSSSSQISQLIASLSSSSSSSVCNCAKPVAGAALALRPAYRTARAGSSGLLAPLVFERSATISSLGRT